MVCWRSQMLCIAGHQPSFNANFTSNVPSRPLLHHASRQLKASLSLKSIRMVWLHVVVIGIALLAAALPVHQRWPLSHHTDLTSFASIVHASTLTALVGARQKCLLRRRNCRAHQVDTCNPPSLPLLMQALYLLRRCMLRNPRTLRPAHVCSLS